MKVIGKSKGKRGAIRKCNPNKLLDWPKNPLCFLHKIRYTFFIFTNNFIDLDILSVLSFSQY